jgi:CRISPR-associated endonuclease/helicase Cas3
MKYIAHKTNEQEQLLIDHLKGCSDLARSFACEFGADDIVSIIALFHDIGKYSYKFQKRIQGNNIQVDHSTAGGKLLYEKNKNFMGLIAAYCIFGHHGGLPNGGSKSQPSAGELYARLEKETEDYSDYINDLAGIDPNLNKPCIDINNGFQAAFFTRMIYSCLVDADWIDTEKFMVGKQPRGQCVEIADLWQKFKLSIEKYQSPECHLNVLRNELLHNCLDAANRKTGLFTLTAPTGSGKTISSMAFALKHAVLSGKRRIIYVVPYNTIIEQNAEVFEKILGTENILQHHSGITYDNDENSPEYKKLLATENWDSPIIVTSSVRFFENLFSNRPSDCRKLHNITRSVIVFDEAQMIPLPYLVPCVETIKELVHNYQCTAVLATATQSSLESYFQPIITTEIVRRPQYMYESFRRVTIDCLDGVLLSEQLVEIIKNHHQALCIVNTRRMAQELVSKIDGSIHLSTTMYPLHRRRVLKMIREKLHTGEKCIVISTSIIEAGVDIDFPVVYREKAGLDSVIQAAGRCNREFKMNKDNSVVYVFETNGKQNSTIAQNICAYNHVEREFEDISSLEAIDEYFKQLRYIVGNNALDRKSVVQLFNDGINNAFSMPFDDVSKLFCMIEENTKTIYVLSDAPQLADRLRKNERNRQLFRELQKYSVSLYSSDYKLLKYQFEILDDEISLLENSELYSEIMGVRLSENGGYGVFLE